MSMYDILAEFFRFISMNFTPLLVILFILLSLVQIAPIKVNPWTSLGRFLLRPFKSMIKEAVEPINKNTEEIKNIVEANTDRILVLENKTDKKDALDARRHIASFNDEIMRNIAHTKDSFDTVLEDINIYENYVKAHEDFKNNITVAAIYNIKEVYKKCLNDHTFLGYDKHE